MMEELKAYPEYKDSGIEWIGTIPKSWDTIKYKRIFKFYNGHGFPDNLQGIKKGEIPFLKVSDIGYNGKYVENAENYVDEITARDNRWNKIEPYSILTAKIGEALRKNHRKINMMLCIIDNNMMALTLYEKYHLDYYYYALAVVDFDWYSNPGAVPSLNNRHLREDYLMIPSIKEQKYISEYLNKKTAEIDNLISDKQRLIKLLEEKRQAIITETVTKGLDPNVKMKDSGIEWIGEIPEHWDISRIKYKAAINQRTLSEQTDKSLGIKYIDIGSVNSNGDIVTIEDYTFDNAPSRARRILKKGDTIVSTVRTYLRAITWVENNENNLIGSTGFAVLTPKKTMEAKYLSYLMRSINYIDEIVARSTGVSYPAITASEIGNLQCILPPLEEQKLITQSIDSALKEMDQVNMDIKNQISNLKEYRESLIYEAVTGKIDVRDYATKRQEAY